MFKIATWNVNSLRVRLPHVLEWLAENKPDVLAIQETKLVDDNFPINEIEKAGYMAVYSGQKTYNGVAILSLQAGKDKITDIQDLDDRERRILAMTIGDTRIVNLYVPNGQNVNSDKYQYKLGWMEKVAAYIKKDIVSHSKYIVLGDFNVAPANEDVHDPKQAEGEVLFSQPERNALADMMEAGLSDCFRLHSQPEKSYSWWDYRLNAFKRNLGFRIDLILANPDMAKCCTKCYIDKVPRGWERPSDHAPVIAEFST